MFALKKLFPILQLSFILEKNFLQGVGLKYIIQIKYKSVFSLPLAKKIHNIYSLQ